MKFEESQFLEEFTKKIAKGSLIVLLGTIIGNSVVILLHLLLSRGLGAKNYGSYVLGLSIFIVISHLSLLGLQNGILRFVALQKGDNDIRRIKGTITFVFTVIFLLSSSVSIGFYLLSNYIATYIFKNPEFAFVLKVFFIALPFFNVLIVSYSTAQAFQRMKLYVSLKYLIQPFLNILVVSVVFLLGFKLKGAIFAFVSSALFSVVICLYYIKKIFPELTSSRLIPIYEIKKLIRFSIPVLLIGFSYILLANTDRIMIGYFKTSTDVGIYNVADKIARQITIILGSVNAIFAPIIADLYNKKRIEIIGKLFKTSTRWIFSLVLILVLICIFFSKDILLLFGFEFVDGWVVLVILSIAYLIAAATGSVGFILQMSGKQDIELLNTLSMVVINIVLNIWLIKAYGILGAAIATGISISLINLIKLTEVKILFNIQPYDKQYIKPFFSGAIIAILYVISLNKVNLFSYFWCFKILILVIGYFFFLFLFVSKEDKVLFKAIRKKFVLSGKACEQKKSDNNWT